MSDNIDCPAIADTLVTLGVADSCGIIIGQNIGVDQGDGRYGFVANSDLLPVAQDMKGIDIIPVMFHEIGHILHGDAGVRFVDFQSVKNAMEDAADLFAQETLINTEQYRAFLVMRDYSLPAIRRFAKMQGVQPFIIIGRLQSDEIIEWSTYSDQIETYEWIA